MKTTLLLENVSIVLVDTKTPANIGAVARCMMNMGLSRLILVNPPSDGTGEAKKLAAGAHEIIDNALVFGTLKDAIADQNVVIGTSRQKSGQRTNILTPREMVEHIEPLLDGNKICFVFGNEVNGLEKKDIASCHEVVSIPASDKFPSLNLSHAVMIVAYELFVLTRNSVPLAKRQAADVRDLERFYEHLEHTLQDIGFLDSQNSGRIMFSLRQLFGRTYPDPREVSILRGILTAIDRFLRSKPQKG